jgi:predicted acylesterase/phospholipase RssA
MSITLALSRCGAKEFTHIRSRLVLEREGLRIGEVAGLSAGSLMSALYGESFFS